jgi:hypothetical protein
MMFAACVAVASVVLLVGRHRQRAAEHARILQRVRSYCVPPVPVVQPNDVDLAEQTAQEPREHHRQAVVAGTLLGSPLDVFERPHAVTDDAQVMLPRDLALGLADAEQLAEAGSPRAREELESGHEISPSASLQRAD